VSAISLQAPVTRPLTPSGPSRVSLSLLPFAKHYILVVSSPPSRRRACISLLPLHGGVKTCWASRGLTRSLCSVFFPFFIGGARPLLFVIGEKRGFKNSQFLKTSLGHPPRMIHAPWVLFTHNMIELFLFFLDSSQFAMSIDPAF